MSGRLVVDGVAGVDRLLYASERTARAVGPVRRPLRRRRRPAHARPAPARAGRARRRRVRLGPDAVGLTPAGLRAALGTSTAPLKARLMDQSRSPASATSSPTSCCGGPGSTRPARRARSTPRELRRLHRHLVATLDRTARRAGRTRAPDARAPRRRRVPEGRHAARPPHDRRPHDVVVSRAPGAAASCEARRRSGLLGRPLRPAPPRRARSRGRRRTRCRPGRPSPGTPTRRPP